MGDISLGELYQMTLYGPLLIHLEGITVPKVKFNGNKPVTTGITSCSAWVHLGNINYTEIKYMTLNVCTHGTSYITRAKH
jgi:hypothetical protein